MSSSRKAAAPAVHVSSSSSEASTSSSSSSTSTIASTTELKHLFLPPLGTNAEYVIVNGPQNSSGDITHILSWIILEKAANAKPTPVLLFSDGASTEQTAESNVNTYTQVQRSMRFATALDYHKSFRDPDVLTLKAGRPVVRDYGVEDYARTKKPVMHIVDQKVVTTLIVKYFQTYGREKTISQLRAGFSKRNNDFFSPALQERLKVKVHAELKKIMTHAGDKQLVILHVRASSKANEFLNMELTIVKQLQLFLEANNYAVWYVVVDGRYGAQPSIVGKRTDPFPCYMLDVATKANDDWGKMFHLELMHELANSKKVKGVIGNTSGMLDLAAFVGNDVYNLHKIKDSLNYQEFRILIQTAFLSLDFIREHVLSNSMQTADKKKGELTKELIDLHMPNLQPWLAKTKDAACLVAKRPANLASSKLTEREFNGLFSTKHCPPGEETIKSELPFGRAMHDAVVKSFK